MTSEVQGSVCLLINNDPIDQAIFTWALNDLSPQSLCCIATSEDEAMDFLTSSRLTPHYIFLESDLPGGNFQRFMRRLKSIEKLGDIPVVIHGKESMGAREDLKNSGAFAFHLKPYSYEGVRAMLYLYFLPEGAPLVMN